MSICMSNYRRGASPGAAQRWCKQNKKTEPGYHRIDNLFIGDINTPDLGDEADKYLEHLEATLRMVLYRRLQLG